MIVCRLIKPSFSNAVVLLDGDALLFVCLSVRSFLCSSVCRLGNLSSHSLRGSTWRRTGAYRIDSGTGVLLTYRRTATLYLARLVIPSMLAE